MPKTKSKFLEAAESVGVGRRRTRYEIASDEEKVGLYRAAERLIAGETDYSGVCRAWESLGETLDSRALRKIVEGVRSGKIKPPKTP